MWEYIKYVLYADKILELRQLLSLIYSAAAIIIANVLRRTLRKIWYCFYVRMNHVDAKSESELLNISQHPMITRLKINEVFIFRTKKSSFHDFVQQQTFGCLRSLSSKFKLLFHEKRAAMYPTHLFKRQEITFWTHNRFMCYVYFWQQTDYFPKHTNQFVLLMASQFLCTVSTN